MNIALWIVQGILALIFVMSGVLKLRPLPERLPSRMAWMRDVSPRTVRLIGALETLGAIGVVLPELTGILTWLTPLAAVGLALTMVGAILTRIRRREYPDTISPSILFALAVFVAIGRFTTG